MLGSFVIDLYLENMLRDDAPITSLVTAFLAISSAIAVATSSDSITIVSTYTCSNNGRICCRSHFKVLIQTKLHISTR